MGRIVTGPKSEAGQRTVSLPTVAVEALDKHRASDGQTGEEGVLFTGPRVSRSPGRCCRGSGRRHVRRLAPPCISASTTCATTPRR